MTEEFDQKRYWIERHENHIGDPRSVGNMGMSVALNLQGEKRVIAAADFAAAELKPCKTVLDIGCGYGRTAPSFCNAGYDYTGIDVAPAAIKAAKLREPRGHFITGSALEIAPHQPPDLICALYVCVHFVDDSDWQNLLIRVSKTLQPNGGFLIADNFPQEKSRPSPHVCARPFAEYVSFLAKIGMVSDPKFKHALAAGWAMPGGPPPFELFTKR